MQQTSKKTAANNSKKRAFREAFKKTISALKDEKKEDAQKLFVEFQKTIDKAAKNNVISKNTASRKKARLSRKIKEAK